MKRYAVILLAALGAAPAPVPSSCTVAIVTMRQTSPLPPWRGEASLDMKGRWHVPDWNALKKMADQDVAPETACVANWLLTHRGEDMFTDKPDNTCDNMAAMQMILNADPAWSACRPRVECRVGDVCS